MALIIGVKHEINLELILINYKWVQWCEQMAELLCRSNNISFPGIDYRII